jgi:hypothetical protein
MKEIVLHEDDEYFKEAIIDEYWTDIIFYDKGDHGSLFKTDHLRIEHEWIKIINQAIEEGE